MKILLTTLITLGSISPVFADQKAGYSEDRTCYKTEYREEYVPGTLENPGYIRTYNETVEVPCRDRGGYTRRETIEYDNNDCTDGKIAGGLLGGAAGAAMSRDDGRWWASFH